MRISIEGSLPRELGLTRSEAKKAAEAFAAFSSARCGEVFREVTVIVQDDEASAAAHEAIMGVGGATDVITQRYEPMPPEPDGVYGELYVNADQAIRLAAVHRWAKRGWDAKKEFLLYIAHGMDHLSGEDDATPEGYARMRRRELLWCSRCASAAASAARPRIRREKR